MSSINLHKIDTVPPKGLDKARTVAKTQKMIKKIQAYQYKMYAEGKRSLLIILQGIDAAGKDGVVRHIFSGMNPLGTKATSFRAPTKEELAHDFLWRIHKATPEVGEVRIFNRSHYEDILVPTIEKTFDKDIIKNRYHQINNFEKLLQENGTTIVKFYLHISKDKQKEKLNERLTDPTKYWKHNIGDWDTRDDFDDYMKVYEDIFAKCNEPEWNIIPADKNWYKLYQVSKILLKVFESMNLKWPQLSPDQETAYLRAKAELAKRTSDEERERYNLKLAKKQEKKLAKKLAKQQKKKAKKEAKKAEKLAKKSKKNQETKTPKTAPKLTPTKKPAPKTPSKTPTKKPATKVVKPTTKTSLKPTTKTSTKTTK